MLFFRRKPKDRPMERVLAHKAIQDFLKSGKLRVSPPYSKDAWNYWHVFERGVIRPITANEILRRYQDWKRERNVDLKLEAAAQHLYPMRPELRREIERLKQIFAAHGKQFQTRPGALKSHIQRVEKKIGYALDPDLCALYAWSNGAAEGDGWFAVNESHPPLGFLTLADSLKHWTTAVENKRGNRKYGKELDRLGHLQRDPRIKSGLWFPPRWWNFASEDSTMAMLDYQPGRGGTRGQVILFFHDPDELHAIGTFLEFFRRSNDLLETHWTQIFGEEEE